MQFLPYYCWEIKYLGVEDISNTPIKKSNTSFIWQDGNLDGLLYLKKNNEKIKEALNCATTVHYEVQSWEGKIISMQILRAAIKVPLKDHYNVSFQQ